VITARPLLLGGVNLRSQGGKLWAPSHAWALFLTPCSGPSREVNQPVAVGVPWLPLAHGASNTSPPACNPLGSGLLRSSATSIGFGQRV